MKTIIGIDPGTRATGFAVLHKHGRSVTLAVAGVIRPKGGSRTPLSERLAYVQERLELIIKEHKPDVAAIEDVFCYRNVRSALALGHVRGSAMVAAAKHGVPIESFTPTEVKRSVTGYGRADKPQIQKMMSMLLRLTRLPAEDAADAMAVAMCQIRMWRPPVPSCAAPRPLVGAV